MVCSDWLTSKRGLGHHEGLMTDTFGMGVGTHPLCHETPDVGQIYGLGNCRVSFEV